MNQIRSDVIHFRCSPEERRAVNLIAHLEGRSLSEWMRELVRTGVKIRGYDEFLFSDLIDTIPLTNVFQVDDSK